MTFMCRQVVRINRLLRLWYKRKTIPSLAPVIHSSVKGSSFRESTTEDDNWISSNNFLRIIWSSCFMLTFVYDLQEVDSFIIRAGIRVSTTY
jgi:hypothetical protein